MNRIPVSRGRALRKLAEIAPDFEECYLCKEFYREGLAMLFPCPDDCPAPYEEAE